MNETVLEMAIAKDVNSHGRAVTKKKPKNDLVKGDKPKNSAFYMDQMRVRLRSEGMVPRDVWIHPDNSKLLRDIEKRLRQPLTADESNLETLMSANQAWNVKSLFEALAQNAAVKNGNIRLNLIEGVQPTIQAVMGEFGDLPIFIAVSGEQILVESTLFPVSAVKNDSEFSAVVLRSRSMFPLSALSIEEVGNGEEAYVMYGALSSISSLDTVTTEITTLAENVIGAADAFSSYTK